MFKVTVKRERVEGGVEINAHVEWDNSGHRELYAGEFVDASNYNSETAKAAERRVKSKARRIAQEER